MADSHLLQDLPADFMSSLAASTHFDKFLKEQQDFHNNFAEMLPVASPTTRSPPTARRPPPTAHCRHSAYLSNEQVSRAVPGGLWNWDRCVGGYDLWHTGVPFRK